MADISKIKLPNGTTYNIKDSVKHVYILCVDIPLVVNPTTTPTIVGHAFITIPWKESSLTIDNLNAFKGMKIVCSGTYSSNQDLLYIMPDGAGKLTITYNYTGTIKTASVSIGTLSQSSYQLF